MEVKSIQYRWAWVTKDSVLSRGVCELLYALFVPSAAATATLTLYDGENTNGDKIVEFRTAESKGVPFSPKAPIYCRRGLYIDAIANVKGVFVQWRELGQGGEG